MYLENGWLLWDFNFISEFVLKHPYLGRLRYRKQERKNMYVYFQKQTV